MWIILVCFIAIALPVLYLFRDRTPCLEGKVIGAVPSDERESTYSLFYRIAVCGKCETVIDDEHARYKTKCCYYCGHTTGYLFDADYIRVRNRFVKGKYIETIKA